jgi:hypothetical protein
MKENYLRNLLHLRRLFLEGSCIVEFMSFVCEKTWRRRCFESRDPVTVMLTAVEDSFPMMSISTFAEMIIDSDGVPSLRSNWRRVVEPAGTIVERTHERGATLEANTH